MNNDIKQDKSKQWKFCPNCGQDIPSINNIKYCIKCGTRLSTTGKSGSPSENEMENISNRNNITMQDHELKISNEKIHELKNHGLWGMKASISIPIFALSIMIGISAIFILIYILISFDLSQLNLDSIIEHIYLDNNLIIILSILELIFIIIPVIYIRKYLQEPTLKNRLALLGVTRRGLSNRDLLKEVSIGLLFSIIGIILVLTLSFLMEIFFPSVEPTNLDSLLFSSLNLVQLILYMLIMIFIVGTSEEILFRGFMQKGLTRTRFGEKWGMILSAFIFAIIHVIVIFYDFISFFVLFIPYFAISLLLGWLYQWRKENLIAVMITHGVYDALTLLLFFLI